MILSESPQREKKYGAGGLLRPGHQANCLAVRKIFPTWFDHLEESYSYKEV